MESEMLRDALRTLLFYSSSGLLTRRPQDSHATSVAVPGPDFTSFRFCPPRSRLPDGAVITKIEDMLEEMVDCLLGKKMELTILLKSRGNRKRRNDTAIEKTTASMVSFPGKNRDEVWKFSVLLRILQFSHEALISGSVMTKRDMFYRDPELFVSQRTVDRYVDDFALTFGIDRNEMNVVAAAKGLVAGELQILMKDATVVDCFVDGGVLIPQTYEIREIKCPSNIRWILIVEKEATFRTLSCTNICGGSAEVAIEPASSLHGVLPIGSGILVTGKGYPDLLTRKFISAVSIAIGDRVTVLSLVDFDPDGIAIHLTYKYGSYGHDHWSLKAPGIVHLGITSEYHASWGHHPELRLSRRDRKLAKRLLERKELDVRTELQRMLMLNIKAQIQISLNN